MKNVMKKDMPILLGLHFLHTLNILLFDCDTFPYNTIGISQDSANLRFLQNEEIIFLNAA